MIDPIPYHDFGGEGPILHFAHPNAYPPACFRQFLTPFTAHYHVTGIYHRPLWPGSRPEELTDWHPIADDLIRFFDQEGYRDVIGMGHSLGAVATMYAAVKRPDLFRVLVLIDPIFFTPAILEVAATHPESIERQARLAKQALNRRYRWQSHQAAFDRFRQKSVFERWSDEVLWDYVNNAILDNGTGEVELIYPREWEAHFYSLLPWDVWEVLPRVTQPTLAVRATESITVFPETWQLWQSLQPQASFVEIPDAGHMLIMERPSRVAESVLNYLQNYKEGS